MQGRLICPLVAEIARLDTSGTATAGGYDPDFRSTKTTYPAGVRTSSRVEMPLIQVPAQVELASHQQQNQQAAGNQPDSRLTLAFHYKDLWRLGLVDPTSREALLRVNDRLVRLLERRTLLPVVGFPVPAGGLYATHSPPAGLGLGGRRNLHLLTFDDRPLGLTAAP